MNKRITSRGIIFNNELVYLLFRRRKIEDGNYIEYYSIPGGKIEDGETPEETVVREINEELSINSEIIEFLTKDETENNIEYYYSLKPENKNPVLGGEELEQNNPDNYYRLELINIKDIDNINVKHKDLIKQCYEKVK